MSLDIAERQILQFYGDEDPPFLWHHRILLVPLGEGEWIICTPDYDV